MNLNKKIIRTMVVILSLFVVLVIYLNYFLVFRSEKFLNSGYDGRNSDIARGRIFDSTGEKCLAYTETEKYKNKKGEEKTRLVRKYEYGDLLSHTLGFEKSGSSYGIEKVNKKDLLQVPSFEEWYNADDGTEIITKRGLDLKVTINPGLTEKVREVLNRRAGDKDAHVVIMNPQTGAVYCAFSKKTFDPTPKEPKITRFEAINEKFYCGSVFKIITAATAIDKGLDDFTHNDTGRVIIGKAFDNDGGRRHGFTDMRKAVRVSSNVYFAMLSKELGKENMIEALNNFCITRDIPFGGLDIVDNGLDINPETQKLYDLNECSEMDFASATLGQTPVKPSVLHMAAAVSGIANENGEIMEPYLVESKLRQGKIVETTTPKVLSQACSPRAAKMVREYMAGCIEDNGGTGSGARISGFRYGGKTGTAQNGGGARSHAWFVGFAPANNPQISFCVMVENAGYGGSNCNPIVKDIVSYCRENGIITE